MAYRPHQPGYQAFEQNGYAERIYAALCAIRDEPEKFGWEILRGPGGEQRAAKIPASGSSWHCLFDDGASLCAMHINSASSLDFFQKRVAEGASLKYLSLGPRAVAACNASDSAELRQLERYASRSEYYAELQNENPADEAAKDWNELINDFFADRGWPGGDLAAFCEWAQAQPKQKAQITSFCGGDIQLAFLQELACSCERAGFQGGLLPGEAEQIRALQDKEALESTTIDWAKAKDLLDYILHTATSPEFPELATSTPAPEDYDEELDCERHSGGLVYNDLDNGAGTRGGRVHLWNQNSDFLFTPMPDGSWLAHVSGGYGALRKLADLEAALDSGAGQAPGLIARIDPQGRPAMICSGWEETLELEIDCAAQALDEEYRNLRGWRAQAEKIALDACAGQAPNDGKSLKI